MRTPMTITRGPNVYQAMKAILVVLRYGKMLDGKPVSNKVQTISIPGLGTGIGQVRPLVCARQMRLSWEDVMHEKFATESGWEQMCANYAYFYTHNLSDIKYDLR